jgi:DNA polymerase I-like protein with 3'-5' exonuclease and polymerase domains
MSAAGQALTINQFSVSSDALEFYRSKDELVDAILEYQDLNKLMTTYVMPYLGGDITRTTAGKSRIVEKKSLLINGKVHTSFKSHGAETGRFSSSDPNLQNIPSSGKYGKLIRNLFIAPPGYKLVVADYSQIEPRIIAAFSQDPVMVENYRTGGDIYTAIGEVMGVDRKAGKVLVLAIAYGVGPDKIAQQVGCSVDEAKKLLNNFQDKFHDIAKYKAKVIRLSAQRTPVPFVETIFGRRRYIPDLRSSERGLKSRADRQAFNTVIQGSAADLMKLAIVRAHSCFVDEPDVNVVLTVHDELVTVAREDLAQETAEAIRVSMEGIKLPEINIPLIADVKIVDKWGEAK